MTKLLIDDSLKIRTTKFFPDLEDKKPKAYDDTSKEIPDLDAIKPEDWDDEEDSEWTPPTMLNPDYKEFKGDNDLYVFPKLKYVGIELWQVKSGTLFDIVLNCDDPEYANKKIDICI
ncbi:hypothetical protein LOK49_LG08G00220 [Camellia lanceoleosa]|uniref:Uncharacterized protein n=1 Tax=Camellia lanceoleosa TaxID=1840588 RepID=A0ACC0GV99_9ERIC|nr:hypothetical protein LOK49_LG08G00220 [Camellia lanceoleosa]